MEKELTESRCRFCDGHDMPSDEDRECVLSLCDEKLDVDISIPLSYGRCEQTFSFDIKFCPFCGKDIKQIKQ